MRYEDVTDGELIVMSKTDAEAFGVLYDRHALSLVSFFYRRTACAETAADLMAETFAEAFASRKRYRRTAAPARAWLFTIAHRQLSKLARRGAVSAKYRARLGMSMTPAEDTTLERLEELLDIEPLRSEVRSALASLPEDTADALLLRVGHDLPYPEVARRLGCSEQAARARVSRGLRRLADTMEAP